MLNDPLTEIGLNQNWLHMQLETMGISLDNVFVGQVNSAGELYVDLFDDSIQLPQSTVRELLLANLESAYADLVKYGLETQDSDAGLMYEKNAEILKMLLKKLRPYLLH